MILFACYLLTSSSILAHVHGHLFVLVSRLPIEITTTNAQTNVTTITRTAIPDITLATLDTILTMNFRKVITTTNNLTDVTVARFVAFVKKRDTSRCWHLSKAVCFRRKFRCQGIGHFARYCKAETAEVRSLEEAQIARVPSSEAARNAIPRNRCNRWSAGAFGRNDNQNIG